MRSAAAERGGLAWGWFVVLGLPLIGLGVLLGRPDLDVEWRHQPSHFWLVLVVAVVNVGLASLTNEAAMRRGDARLVLVSLAFGASAGFLGLHALATPGVLLPGSNLGFVVATPVGLTLAAGLAAASALPLGGPRGDLVLRHAHGLRFALLVLIIGWAVASLARLPPLTSEVPPAEVAPPLRSLALVAVALYAFAAWHFLRLLRARARPLLLAIVVALVLLAEAMVTVVFSRDWHLSWWEWHLLMAMAFGAVAWGARVEYRRQGSLTGAFGGLYLQGTLERVSRWHADALSDLADAQRTEGSRENVLRRLRMDGASTDEVALLDRAASELHRLDELFRPYLPEQFAARALTDPGRAHVGSGEEREVTVLFADLSGFTSFSESHRPADVVELLNAVWGAVVPVLAAEDALIENFTGDGLLALFNALGDQPDHAERAGRAAIAIRDAVDALAGSTDHPATPRLHVGINTGPAFVGSVGAAGRRAFSAIGDTTNLGARLLAVAGAGEFVAGEATRARLGPTFLAVALDPVRVKGKQEPVRAWRLDGRAASVSGRPPRRDS